MFFSPSQICEPTILISFKLILILHTSKTEVWLSYFVFSLAFSVAINLKPKLYSWFLCFVTWCRSVSNTIVSLMWVELGMLVDQLPPSFLTDFQVAQLNTVYLMSAVTVLLLWPGTRLAGPKSEQAESEGARTQSDGALRGRVVSAGCYCLPGQSNSLSVIFILKEEDF